MISNGLWKRRWPVQRAFFIFSDCQHVTKTLFYGDVSCLLVYVMYRAWQMFHCQVAWSNPVSRLLDHKTLKPNFFLTMLRFDTKIYVAEPLRSVSSHIEPYITMFRKSVRPMTPLCHPVRQTCRCKITGPGHLLSLASWIRSEAQLLSGGGGRSLKCRCLLAWYCPSKSKLLGCYFPVYVFCLEYFLVISKYNIVCWYCYSIRVNDKFAIVFYICSAMGAKFESYHLRPRPNHWNRPFLSGRHGHNSTSGLVGPITNCNHQINRLQFSATRRLSTFLTHFLRRTQPSVRESKIMSWFMQSWWQSELRFFYPFLSKFFIRN